jgi:hypothetical protein
VIRAVALAGLAGLLAPASADAQVYVGPRRPGQSAVRWSDFTWARVDLLDGEAIGDDTAGGVRLYFYEEERDVAERASAAIETAYRELADDFAFVPQHRFPYVLYSTYRDSCRPSCFRSRRARWA